MKSILKDFKFGFRHWRRKLGASAVIVGTLTLLMCVTGLLLSILNYERHRMLPFPDPDRVVTIWNNTKSGSTDLLPVRVYGEGRNKIQSLEFMGVTGMSRMEVLLSPGLEPKSLSIYSVSPSIFDICGIAPIKGRVFSEEEVKSREPLLVISYDLWQKHFHGDENIIGKEVNLGDVPHQVIGVMPEDYENTSIFYGTDVWKGEDFDVAAQFDTWWRLHGRLKPGFTYDQLNAELASIAAPLVQTAAWGRSNDDHIGLIAMRADKRPGDQLEPEMIFALSIPLFVIGISGFNITNILLARLLSRRHEFAVRFALGASRRRLIVQLLTECVLLSLVGGVMGIIMAKWISVIFEANGLKTQFNLPILGIVALSSVAIGMLVGWIPAWRATRGDIHSDIKDSSRTSSGGIQRHRLRNILVIGQMSMATALCISAALLVKSYLNKKAFDPGFDTSNMLRVGPSLVGDGYEDPENRKRYLKQAIQRIGEIPGVEDVSLASGMVIGRWPFPTSIEIAGESDSKRCFFTIMSSNHLRMLSVPVLKGRNLIMDDRLGAPPVMVVNQSFVASFCGEQDPLGMMVKVHLDKPNQWVTIVGVVADRPNLGRERDLGPEAYVSVDQFLPVWSNAQLYVVTQSNPVGIQGLVREALQSIDRNVPVNHPVLIDDDLRRVIEFDMDAIRVVVGICIFGMFIALLGIYGVVSYAVSERTYELGIRLSLGATHWKVLAMTVRQGMRYAVIGLIIGLFLGGGISQFAGNLFYDVSGFDVPTFLVVSATMLSTALLATLVPAWRTLKIDPMDALRYE